MLLYLERTFCYKSLVDNHNEQPEDYLQYLHTIVLSDQMLRFDSKVNDSKRIFKSTHFKQFLESG